MFNIRYKWQLNDHLGGVFTSLPLFAMGRRCREFVVTCCSMDGFLLAVTCLQISGTAIAVLDAAYVDWRMSLLAGHGADHSGARYFIRSFNLIFNTYNMFILTCLLEFECKKKLKSVRTSLLEKWFPVCGFRPHEHIHSKIYSPGEPASGFIQHRVSLHSKTHSQKSGHKVDVPDGWCLLDIPVLCRLA